MKEYLRVAGKTIGREYPVFIIAEAGVNHEGDLAHAKRLVDAAVAAGADAVKFQTFSAERSVAKDARMAQYQKENLASDQSQFDLLKGLELAESAHFELAKYCAGKGIIFLSTPHSNRWSVDLLERVGVPAYKTGSGDLTNIPFLGYLASRRKPCFVATGMASLAECYEALGVFRGAKADDIVLLHCTTNYPTPLEDVNLLAMRSLERNCGVLVGYSDHTEGILVPALAAHMGAVVIEKHFTLDRSIARPKSPDHMCSLEPDELVRMVKVVRAMESLRSHPAEEALSLINESLRIDVVAEQRRSWTLSIAGFDYSKVSLLDSGRMISLIQGDGVKRPNANEILMASSVRKSVIARRPLQAGRPIGEDDIDVLRPEGGYHPRYFDEILDHGILIKDVASGEPLNPSNCVF
ncbi:MAG: N-acetylneuraminate synthase family protein [Nanoarchaeota archaeon]